MSDPVGEFVLEFLIAALIAALAWMVIGIVGLEELVALWVFIRALSEVEVKTE